MSDLARQQADFQRGILGGDDTVLGEILDSPKEKRETLYGVYRYAYGSRLVEAMRSDHELLHAYLGDEMFDEMGHAYVKAHPSEHPNLRWFSRALPEFLKSAAPYSDHPVLSDLAALEKTLNDAFDGRDDDALDACRHGPLCAGGLERSSVHSRIRPLRASIFPPTRPRSGWRSRTTRRRRMRPRWKSPRACWSGGRTTRLMFRELPAEEAMMWDEAANGIPFGVLCAMLATYDDPDGAAARGAGYLHGWISAGLLTGASTSG